MLASLSVTKRKPSKACQVVTEDKGGRKGRREGAREGGREGSCRRDNLVPRIHMKSTKVNIKLYIAFTMDSISL